MDLGIVTIKYSPLKWAQMQNGTSLKLPNDPGSKQNSRSNSPTKSAQNLFYTRRKHVQALSSLSFIKPIEDSLQAMKNYQPNSENSSISFEVLEQNWYGDVTNVGQRLKLLRDTFKVIQTVRKKKAAGQKVDFKPVYDIRASQIGSPPHLDDEGPRPKTEDEDEYRVKVYPPPARRGRPRKRRGRERKVPVGSERSTPAPRGRPGRKPKDRSLLPLVALSQRAERSTTPAQPSHLGDSSVVNFESDTPSPSPAPGVVTSDASFALSSQPETSKVPEPQGPPLMYLPPILPSQRLQLVQGIPPYKHMREIETGNSTNEVPSGQTPTRNILEAPANSSVGGPQSIQAVPSEADAPHAQTMEHSRREEVQGGPEASEMSAVFRQLAEGQASLPSLPSINGSFLGQEARQQYNSQLPLAQSFASTPNFQTPYKQQIPSEVPNVPLDTNSTFSNGNSVDYDLHRVEMELAAALNLPFDQKADTPNPQASNSDQSFINRLLN